jgi:hypothetical protein
MRKRLALQEHARYLQERALRGDDDDCSRRIRAACHEAYPNLDLNRIEIVEELKAWLAVDSVDFFSTIKLPTHAGHDRNAAAAALAHYERLRGEGYSPAKALKKAADQYRADHPEHADKSDAQVKRIWYR